MAPRRPFGPAPATRSSSSLGRFRWGGNRVTITGDMPESASHPPSPRGRPVYLDNHATTRVDPRVVAGMLPFFDVDYGNAASINHRYGWHAAEAVDRARGEVAGLLMTSAEAIVFTSGGTRGKKLAPTSGVRGERGERHT